MKVKYCTARDLTLISGLIAHIIPDSLYSCHTQNLRSQRQAIRIALKEIDSIQLETLENLSEDLQSSIESVFRETKVYFVPTTTSAERAIQLKRKYKRLSQQLSLSTNHYRQNRVVDLA